MQYLDGPRGFANFVKDAIRSKDNLAQSASCSSRVGGADEWKGAENANVVENPTPHPMCCF